MLRCSELELLVNSGLIFEIKNNRIIWNGSEAKRKY